MTRRTPHRLAAALTTLGCLLMLTAAPASGATTTLYIHAGTMDISIDVDPEYEVVIGFGGQDHTCEVEEQINEYVVDVDGSMTTVEEVRIGAEDEDGYYASFFTFGSNEYLLDLRIGDPVEIGFGTNTGTISGTHPNQTITQHLLMEGLIYQTEDCEKTGEPICHMAGEATVSGNWDGTTMMIGPLNGSGVPQVAFCDAPFAGLSDGHATFTGLTFDDTPPT